LPPVPPPKPRTETARVPESKPLPKAPPASGTVRADVAERANAAQTSAPAQAELQSRAANLMYEKQLAQNLAQANAPAQTATQAAAQQAIDRLSVVEPRPVSAAAQISRAGKKVGGRIFYREGDRWVDADSLGHAGAKVREIKRDSKEFAEMTLKEPALAGIPADAPVLLYWNGEVVLIRQ
jgi:hypothetical protein